MSVTAKDFIAEASDIADYLTEYADGKVVSAYIMQRCATLKAANPLFDRDKFISMASGIATTETMDEVVRYNLSRINALELMLRLRIILDGDRVIPARCDLAETMGQDGSTVYTLRVTWRGRNELNRAMRAVADAFGGSNE